MIQAFLYVHLQLSKSDMLSFKIKSRLIIFREQSVNLIAATTKTHFSHLRVRSCAPRERVGLCAGLTATSHAVTSHSGKHVWANTDWLIHINAIAVVTVCAGNRGVFADPPPFAKLVLARSADAEEEEEERVPTIQEQLKSKSKSSFKEGDLANVWMVSIENTPCGLQLAKRFLAALSEEEQGERVSLNFDGLSDEIKSLLLTSSTGNSLHYSRKKGHHGSEPSPSEALTFLFVLESEADVLSRAVLPRGARRARLASSSSSSTLMTDDENVLVMRLPREWSRRDAQRAEETIRKHSGKLRFLARDGGDGRLGRDESVSL